MGRDGDGLEGEGEKEEEKCFRLLSCVEMMGWDMHCVFVIFGGLWFWFMEFSVWFLFGNGSSVVAIEASKKSFLDEVYMN